MVLGELSFHGSTDILATLRRGTKNFDYNEDHSKVYSIALCRLLGEY